jgi:hypothetical protein
MDPKMEGINQLLRDAKIALKKSKRVDYYKLLEISQDATDYDIKKVIINCRTGSCASSAQFHFACKLFTSGFVTRISHVSLFPSGEVHSPLKAVSPSGNTDRDEGWCLRVWNVLVKGLQVLTLECAKICKRAALKSVHARAEF